MNGSPSARRSGQSRPDVLIDLALQGGGSHGAFTWGVLDRLLEESWLKIDAISGTSAGAMNAAVLASGWLQGGAEGARQALRPTGGACPRPRPSVPSSARRSTGSWAAGRSIIRPAMSPWTS